MLPYLVTCFGELEMTLMPTIHKIQSIKIDVYGGEHPPPHFHAIYAEHEILLEIPSLATYQGSLPSSQYRKVIEWANHPRILIVLLDNFFRLNPRLKK